MKQQFFEETRGACWTEFGTRLDHMKQGYRLADGDDAEAFVAEYQRITRDLSVAKARGYSRRLVSYLNDLVVRGHNVVYVNRTGFIRATLEFVAFGFPQRVRAEWPYMLLATALFLVPLIGVVVTILIAPEWVYSVMASEQVSSMESMYDPAARSLGRERQSDTDFAMFGFYIWNNISISFQMFAGGMLFGIGTIFYLLFNGVFIGAAAGHLIGVGFESTFLSFVVGHGAFELTAIVLAGGGGLILGHSLLAPGRLTRGASLRAGAARAVEVVFGTTLMLVIAAFVEAFWSSSSIVPPLVKYVVGGVLWTLVFAYLLLSGRRRGS